MDAETLENVLTHFGVRDCEKLLQLKRDAWDAAFNGNNAWQLKTQAAERDHVRGIVAEFLQYQKTVLSISGLARLNPSDDR